MSDPVRQMWDPDAYAAEVRFVSELGRPVIELLAPRRDERILDLGCGDGLLAAALADRGCRVVGVDTSPDMVAAAVARGVEARVMDGSALRFDQEFDAVFSNAALHWMTDPDAVIDGVWGALKPGGRFVGEFGGEGNIAAIVAALAAALVRRGLTVPQPWYFPSAVDYRKRLEARGFVLSFLSLFERPTPLPHGMTAWLTIFTRPFLGTIPEQDHKEFLAEVTHALRPQLCDARGIWTADYVRLRFSADRP